PGETYFGSDIFNRACGPPPVGRPGAATIHAPPIASAPATRPRIPVHWSGGSVYTVQVRSLTGRNKQWRTLVAITRETHLSFTGTLGATYLFRVRAGAGPFAAATTVVPTGTRIPHGHFSAGWRVVRRRGAWLQHAIQ